jgi:hypothetical protein
MGILQTHKLKPGLVLAEDVRDINGRLLLGKGNRIGQSHIRIFKIWGITDVNVYGAIGLKDKPESLVNPELIETTEDKIKPIFAHVDLDHPEIKEIFRLSIEHRSRNHVLEKEAALALKPDSQNNNNKHLNKNFLKRLAEKKISLPEIPSIE